MGSCACVTQIRFKVAKEGGAMKKFEGCWNIGAFAASDMDRIRPAGTTKLQLTPVSPAALRTSAAALSAAAAAAGGSSGLPAAALEPQGGDWLKPAQLFSRFQKGEPGHFRYWLRVSVTCHV